MKKAVAEVSVIVAGVVVIVAGSAPSSYAAANQVGRHDASAAKVIIKSDEFAGYEPAPGQTTIRAKFKVPSISCTSTSAGISPGVQLNGIGSIDSGAAALIYCSNGQPIYYAHLIIGTTQTNPFTVQPGDTLTVTASDTISKTSATIKDDTTGASDSSSGPGDGAISDYVGIFDVGLNGLYAPPIFKTVPFSAVTLSGHALGSARLAKIERVSGKTILLEPTAITGKKEFSVLFKHS